MHKLMRCIDLNIVHTRLTSTDTASDSEYLQSVVLLRAAYDRYPELLHRSEALIDQCEITLDSGTGVNRRTFTGNPGGDYELLTKLAREGCRRRYTASHRQAIDRTEKNCR